MEINFQPPDAQVRSFGRLWLPLFCFGVVGMKLWRGDAGILLPVCCTVVAVLSFISSYTALPVLRWIFIFLSLLVYPLAWVIQNLLLAATYYLLVFPIGWFLRWRGHDPLRLRPPPQGASAWKKPDENNAPRRYFRQY